MALQCTLEVNGHCGLNSNKGRERERERERGSLGKSFNLDRDL